MTKFSEKPRSGDKLLPVNPSSTNFPRMLIIQLGLSHSRIETSPGVKQATQIGNTRRHAPSNSFVHCSASCYWHREGQLSNPQTRIMNVHLSKYIRVILISSQLVKVYLKKRGWQGGFCVFSRAPHTSGAAWSPVPPRSSLGLVTALLRHRDILDSPCSA